MEQFAEVGHDAERRWQQHGFHEDALPAVAEAALLEARLHERLGYIDIARWLARTQELPRQADLAGGFGAPPITLYSGQKLRVEALFWLDGSVEIHHHSFAGAFQVFEGGSIHGLYDFHLRERYSASVVFGDVRPRTMELLRRGDVRQIIAGPQMIHATFHLERPSVTVVLRSHRVKSAMPQLLYQPPSISIDPTADTQFDDELFIKQLQLLHTLAELEHPELDAIVRDTLRGADLARFLRIVMRVDSLSKNPERAHALLDQGREQFGDVINEVVPALRKRARVTRLRQLRASIKDPEGRFFLGVLVNAGDAGHALDLIRSYRPERAPGDTVAGWIEDFSRRGVGGLPKIENPSDDHAVLGRLAALLLQGVSDDELAPKLAGFGLNRPSAALASLAGELRRSPLFAHYFEA